MRTRFSILLFFLIYRIALAQSPEQINIQLDQAYFVAGTPLFEMFRRTISKLDNKDFDIEQ